MGITERKEREKLQRSNSIIDAAEKLFFKKGIEHTTMDDVAQEAELSKGTLYLYFKSKEDLCVAISIRGALVLKELFTKAVNSQKLGIDKVKTVGQAYFEFNYKYPQYVQMMMYYENLKIDMENATENVLCCMNEGMNTMQILVDAIQLGIEDGSIKNTIDPLKTSFLLWSFSAGLIQIINLKDHVMEQCGIQSNDLVNYFFEFIHQSLKK